MNVERRLTHSISKTCARLADHAPNPIGRQNSRKIANASMR
jgi:hypothetical protein